MINRVNLTFRSATPDNVDFVAWCNFTVSSPAPGFCWWDPLIEGFGIETITFIRQAVALDLLDLRSEDWGQRHFCIQDPNGIYLDIVQSFEPTEEYWSDYVPE